MTGATAHIEAMLSTVNHATGSACVSLNDAMAKMFDVSYQKYIKAIYHCMSGKTTAKAAELFMGPGETSYLGDDTERSAVLFNDRRALMNYKYCESRE